MNKFLVLSLLVIISSACFGQDQDSLKNQQAFDSTANVKKKSATLKPAEYPGGLKAMGKFIGRHLHYPPTSRRLGIFGNVYVTFVIEKDGTLTDIHVVKGLDKDCDAEAIRVVSKMPPWKPAEENGSIVKSRFLQPIRFDRDMY